MSYIVKLELSVVDYETVEKAMVKLTEIATVLKEANLDHFVDKLSIKAE
jgi:hypothetical protein